MSLPCPAEPPSIGSCPPPPSGEPPRLAVASAPGCSWRPEDAEALRIALSIPVTAAALLALQREVASLEIHYPVGVCAAQGHLEAVGALNRQLAALTPAELNAPIRSRRKGVAGGDVPNPLPLSKLDVVEYATELLLEETETEWSAEGPSAGVVLSRQRSAHIEQLVLLLPGLANWRLTAPDPFQGRLVRGWTMSEPLSPLNQGLNPLRGAPLWGQLVAMPTASPLEAEPLWLAVQPYANARLCLFEVDRPKSKEPIPIRRHVLDVFLRFEQVVGGTDDTALTDPGDERYSGFLCRAAVLPLATTNTFDWLAAEQAWSTPGFRHGQALPWDPALLGTVVAPCEGVIWLGDLALLQSEGVLPNEPRAQFAGCLVQHFGARYGSGGIGLLTQPLLGEAIELVLKPHSVLVLRPGDSLNLLAVRYGTTAETLHKLNPHLESTQTISTAEGDSLTVLAGRHGTTVETLRRLNPVLQQAAPHVTASGDTLTSVAAACEMSVTALQELNPHYARWPRYDPLPIDTALLVLAVRPSTPLQSGQPLLVPAYLPSTELPAGEWIVIPRRRAAVMGDVWDTSTPPPVPQA